MDHVQGGYIAMRAGELLSLLIAYKRGLKPAAIRLYLAAHLEAVAQSFTPHQDISLSEIAQRAKLATYTAQKALRELEATGLLTLKEGNLTFCATVTPEAEPYLADLKTSPQRPVPIPRRIMRVLARHGRASELVGALIHLLRCLFINQGNINHTGFIKNAFITRLTGLSDRTIQGARHWMKAMGWIIPKSVTQGVLNRFGGCFSVNLNPPLEDESEALISLQEPSRSAEFAPPPSASLLYTNNQPNYQYVPPQEDPPSFHSGVFAKTMEKPTLTDIQQEDLQVMPRLEALYRQAIDRKWLPDCEASIKNFVAAATRSIQIEGNPVKIFVGLVKKGLWGYITQAQEDKSLKALKNYRENNPEAFTGKSPRLIPIATPEPITSRTGTKAIRPERVIFRAGRSAPALPKQQSNLTPISTVISSILAGITPTNLMG